MPDRDPAALLDQARRVRAEEARARRLADLQTSEETRATLLRIADEMKAEALVLEQQAFNTRPGMQEHAIPEQMQQSRVTPAKGDDPE